ncbi:MAG: O-acetylhomoserine aminocarboxypropyltransferase/cysteine synthase [Lentisphaeria bacterium]|nr:O-acetylhomoserine aminocarboxypropyltransferase/cysteine synthase [Lentisphaeria bacterium]
MKKQQQSISTLALHAGYTPDPTTGACAVPIYQTASYAFRDSEHAANLFGLKEFGNIYTRLMNPTTDVLEQRLAALHGAAGAVATASGMAAITAAVLNITSAGQNIVSGSNLYGGTVTLFTHTLKRFGIEARFVDSSDPANFAAAIDENTRLVYTESIGNPRCNVDDIAGIAAVAHAHDLPLLLDNTVSPPPIFNPFDHGADIILYSLTKILGGHGTSIGGAVVEKGDFDWKTSGKYPEITEPDEAYHGVNFWDAFGGHPDAVAPGLAFVLKIRTGLLRDMGACLSPFNSFQILQGIETLPLRARKHCENAREIAEFLEAHEAVTWVNYAGLPGHPDYERAKALMPVGPSAVFGFGVKGGREAGRTFIDNVELCTHLANILDAKTLVIHPASTTHQQLTEDELVRAGVTPDFVRISVGLEDVGDIKADLNQALRASQS